MIASVAWHNPCNKEVIVFAGFSDKVNSATSILKRCVNEFSKAVGGNCDNVSYKRSLTIAIGALSC